MLQEILSLLKSGGVATGTGKTPKPVTTKDIRHEAALASSSSCDASPMNQHPVPAPTPSNPMYDSHNQLAAAICRAVSLNDAVELTVAPIKKIRYHLTYDEDTGELTNTDTNKTFPDIDAMATALFDAITKPVFDTTARLSPKLTEDQRKLWGVIMESAADPEGTYRICSKNQITVHLSSILFAS
jgi:hypothetical protein